jgi:hypothetical protein
MGNCYVNMATKGPSQIEVSAALTQRRRKAFVCPTSDGFTVFCNEQAETQDPHVIDELARTVSGDLACPLVAVLNHDDDILWLSLYEKGELLDQYDSFPTYFEDAFSPPKGGDASKFRRILAAGANESTIEGILRKPHNDEGYIFEIERHADLASALGMPAFSVGLL